jgi:hypothetical protein
MFNNSFSELSSKRGWRLDDVRLQVARSRSWIRYSEILDFPQMNVISRDRYIV